MSPYQLCSELRLLFRLVPQVTASGPSIRISEALPGQLLALNGNDFVGAGVVTFGSVPLWFCASKV